MALIYIIFLGLSFLTSLEAVPRRLNPQCRSNVCDDRPVCPRTTCRCIFASRMDCSAYYQCVNGKPFQHRCSPGLLFNNETLSCDYSYNVNCDSGPNESTSTEINNKISTVLSTTMETSSKAVTTEISSTEPVTEVATTTISTEAPTSGRTQQELTSTTTVTEFQTTESDKENSTTQNNIETTTKSAFSETEDPIIVHTTLSIVTAYSKPESTTTTNMENETTTERVTSDLTTELTLKTTANASKISTVTKAPTSERTEQELTSIITETEFQTTEFDSETSTTQNVPETTTMHFASETQDYTTVPATRLTSYSTSTEEETASDISSKTVSESTIKTTQDVSTITSVAPENATAETTEINTSEPPTKVPVTPENDTEITTEDEQATTVSQTSTILTTKFVENPSSTDDHFVTNYTVATTEREITTTTKYPLSEFSCPTRFGLFADPKSCRRFYHCSHWKPYHKWCPSNLHFNPRLNVCDWPYRAGCDAVQPTTSVPERTTPSLKPNNTQETCDCEYCELPVLSDCSAYVLCIDNVPTYMHCGEDLYFNPMTGTCDLTENVHCLQENVDCVNPFGRYMLEGSCSYFIECRNGDKTIKKCPEGLQFNQTSEMCSWLGSCAGALSGEFTSSGITASIGLCNGCEYCFKPTASDCASYVRCFQGVATVERCSSGLFFNQDTQMCDHDYNVQCPNPDEQPECPEMFGYFPYPGECGTYLHCVNGSARLKSCPGVLHFDPVKKQCDWPWAAGCSDSSSNPKSDPDSEAFECDCDCCLEPVENDCRNFSLCVNKVGFKGSCSSGLLFNPQTENCDFAENVDCDVTPEIPGYFCPEHEGLFPHLEDCKKFIHCAHGLPYIKDCPSDLHFNPKLKVCDWPHSAGCQGYPTNETSMEDGSIPCDICESCFIPDESDCASYMFCRNGIGTKLRCSGNLLFNPAKESCDLANNVKCPDQPSSRCPKPDGLFPAKECSQFLHCSNGIAYLKDCPDGLHFNALILVCDWPENAKCGSESVSPTLPPSEDNDKDTSNRTCNCDCCFLPHERDCSKYILCLDGRMHEGQCSRGLLFNPNLQNCDLAERVTCGGESPPCTEPNGLFPDGKSCSSYIKCSNGISTVEYCLNGTHFSAELKQCMDSCKAGCDSSYKCFTDPTTVTSSPELDICLQPDGFYPVANDCTSFYVCSDGQPQVVKCPNELHYNSFFEVCEDPCDAKCDSSLKCESPAPSPSTPGVSPSTTLSPFCPERDGLFPNPSDCSSFYQCSAGRVYPIKCPEGLHFCDRDKVCKYPCEAKCNTSIDCNSTSTTSSVTQAIYPSTTLSPFCSEKNGLFSNKNDCTAFYQCSDGRAYLVACPPGLHFSDDHKVCDYPCEAKCDSTINCNSSSPSSSVSTTAPSSFTLSPLCLEKDGLFPNNEDCSSFYQCSDGRTHLVKCPSGLHFSDKDKVCEFPCNAKCNASLDCSKTTPQPTSPASSPHCPTPDGLHPVQGDCTAFYLCSNGKEYLIHCPPGLHFSQQHETCETPCVALCNVTFDCGTSVKPVSSTPHPTSPECKTPDGLFSNPDDCGSFYQCSNGQSHLIKCPNELHFSQEDSACERPCVAGCNISIECPPEIPERKGNCTCDGCYLPDPTDCSAFYNCDHGKLSKSYCPFGTLFSKISSVCEDESVVDCEANGDPSMCPEPYGFFPYPGECKKFIHCDNSIAHVKECQGDLEYDPLHRVCKKPKGYCGEVEIDPNCPEPTGMFPDSTDCSLFYHCEHGVAYPKRCSSPLMFNPDKKVCDWPQNVDCGRDSSITTGPTASTQITVNASTSSVRPPTSPTPPISECQEVAGVICPCACRVPTYDECSSYFQCQEDGTACKKFCPHGLYFNKREMVCDLPENVECRDFFFTSIRRAKFFSHHPTS